MDEKAIIPGAGPAGLPAAYEFFAKTGIVPIIMEKSGDIGGIFYIIKEEPPYPHWVYGFANFHVVFESNSDTGQSAIIEE